MKPARGLTVILALLATACGSSAVRRAAPAPLDGCLARGADTRAVRLLVPDTAPLPGVLIGRGATAVVLSNESDEDLCSWLGFAATLTRRGYAVLVYDYVDPRALALDARAGAEAARRAGARRVVLMGASVGARGSILAAAAHAPGVVGLVSLSAERTVSSDPVDLVPRARRVSVPTLLVSAAGDPFVAGATGPLLRALASHDKHALVVPGLDHGTALLAGQSGARVVPVILAFLARLDG